MERKKGGGTIALDPAVQKVDFGKHKAEAEMFRMHHNSSAGQ